MLGPLSCRYRRKSVPLFFISSLPHFLGGLNFLSLPRPQSERAQNDPILCDIDPPVCVDYFNLLSENINTIKNKKF
jgi:hypothetical protein